LGGEGGGKFPPPKIGLIKKRALQQGQNLHEPGGLVLSDFRTKCSCFAPATAENQDFSWQKKSEKVFTLRQVASAILGKTL